MKQQLKRWGTWVALVAGLGGCGEEKAPLGEGGKERVLFIRRKPGRVAAGLKAHIDIPNRRFVGGFDEPQFITDAWDFADATLEAEGPPGLTFEVARVGPDPLPARESSDFNSDYHTSGFIVHVGCGAAPGVAHEVRLRVKGPGGEVRYEDALDLTCHEPTRLELRQAPDGEPTPGTGHYLVGSTFQALPALFAGEQALVGEGLVLTERRGLLNVDMRWGHTPTFKVVGAGSGPELSYRDATLTLPLEAVAGEDTRLVVEPPVSKQVGSEVGWGLSAQALSGDGVALRGLHTCAWRVELPGGGVQQTMDACREFWVKGPKPVRACVTVLERTGCGDFT
jgi:hypothetical protein